MTPPRDEEKNSTPAVHGVSPVYQCADKLHYVKLSSPQHLTNSLKASMPTRSVISRTVGTICRRVVAPGLC